MSTTDATRKRHRAATGALANGVTVEELDAPESAPNVFARFMLHPRALDLHGAWSEATIARMRRLVARTVTPVVRAEDLLRRRRDALAVAAKQVEGRVSAVLAAIPHWRTGSPAHDDMRIQYLTRCLDGVFEIEAGTNTAVILTNDPHGLIAVLRSLRRDEDVQIDISESTEELPSALTHLTGRHVVVVGWKPGRIYRHGYYLTWSHVEVLKFAAASGRYSHFIYLEDDMRVSNRTIQYWCAYRSLLAPSGYLPGFVRYEKYGGRSYLTDQSSEIDVKTREVEGVLVPPGPRPATFIRLNNPYQAMYVLDRSMFATHLSSSPMRSPLRSRTVPWGVRERAAAGPIFGLAGTPSAVKTVVPILAVEGRRILDKDCLVEHMAGNYASNPASPFGSIAVEDFILDEATEI